MLIFLLIVLGLCLGSFIDASVWRHHEKMNWVSDRSKCETCNHTLAPLDLIPVLSWVFLRAKCRYCKSNISCESTLVELLTAALFILSYYFWPTPITGLNAALFTLWLTIVVLLVALVVYDIRWFLLPNALVIPLGILSTAYVVIEIVKTPSASRFLGAIIGALLTGGIYYFLFQVSSGKWIGGGDVKLGFVLGLMVGGPFMSFLLLFMSSFSGTLFFLPLILTKKINAKTKIPFGPFLILGFILVVLFGSHIEHGLLHIYS